ncbi:hypothetical protein BDZ89DRAFT_1063590 [Hymenopellis radicata]|nr:hypothetical protein BDZ89DRAFT_1063590 [Hymenopellis radicata]
MTTFTNSIAISLADQLDEAVEQGSAAVSVAQSGSVSGTAATRGRGMMPGLWVGRMGVWSASRRVMNSGSTVLVMVKEVDVGMGYGWRWRGGKLSKALV